jgi:hypothetical protein
MAWKDVMTGVLAFVVVTATALGLVLLVVIRGLGTVARERGRARALAASLGWQSRGSGEFQGVVGEAQWRGGSYSDPEAAGRWTEFVAGVPGLANGGFQIGVRGVVYAQRDQADPSAEPMSWCEVNAGSESWRSQYVLFASDARWASLVDADFERLWHQSGALDAHAHARQLRVRRSDDTEAPLESTVAVLRVGEALLKASQRVLAG